jgi:hypothetical protein
MSEQPDYDPDGTGLRDHVSGDAAPELDASGLTDDLPEANTAEAAEGGPAADPSAGSSADRSAPPA